MKKSTKIIGATLLAVTGLGLFFLNKSKKNNPNGGYLDDVENNSVLFNPKATADTLYEAMKNTGKSLFNSAGFSLGTQRDIIFEVLTTISPNQFNSVVKAFGLKAYNKYTGGQIFPIWSTPTKYGLKTWLKEELPPKDYAILKTKYPKNL
ncbi:hypothetical protein [Flavobacterium sp.]|uniref:hypothetical protein n=1 Tax=Flavobacterium sp. TaxID=239 RepID=UPI00374DC10C